MIDHVVRKIKFTGDKALIKLARDELKIEDVVTPFLEFQSTRLRQVLSKIRPLDDEHQYSEPIHPLRIAGLL